ncbi:MAG: O-methyltransferase [Thermoplasmata archaeon]
MDLEGKALRDYVESLLPHRDELLKELESVAQEEGIPIVGPHVGSLLMILASASGARRAVELGTAIGYSAIWLARGMGAGGRLVTIEMREEMARRAGKSIERAGLQDSVEILVGKALELLPTLGDGFDIVFNDINKEDYPAVLPLCKEALRSGGLLLTDNVLWGGRVVSEQDVSPSTEAIREYNRVLAEDEEWTTVILPIRDGVSISVKRV